MMSDKESEPQIRCEEVPANNNSDVMRKEKMEIKVKSSDDLSALLDALADEIITAHVTHRLYCDLVDAIPEYHDEMNKSPAFWRLTLDSLRDARILRLCRIFDQEASSLNLGNLLETIRANTHLFGAEEFKKRLKDNPHVESLAEHPRSPDMTELEANLVFARPGNAVVKKLLLWRNNIVAHRGAKFSLGKKEILEDNPLSKEEMDDLLDKALRIFNKYSSLFRASTWSRDMIGQDDYKGCLSLIRDGVIKYKQDMERELQELKKRQRVAEQSAAPLPPAPQSGPSEDAR